MRLLLGSLAGVAIVATACGSLVENGSLAGPSASGARLRYCRSAGETITFSLMITGAAPVMNALAT